MSDSFNFNELKSTARLPTPSGTALAIMRLAQQEDATLQQVAQLIKADPALSGRVLSFANSAAFGARRAIASVQDAAMLMGLQAVRNFALSISLLDNNKNGNCPGFDYGIYWSQSLAMAVAISVITAHERSVAPEEAFTVGLLSEIGRLALACVWPEIYGECLQQAKGEELLKLEQTHFSIDHRALCLMLLADWGMPGIFLDALKHSYEVEITDVSRTVRFARQLNFARNLARYCLTDASYQPVLLAGLEKEACHHAMDREALQAIIDEVIEQWRRWGKEIDVKTDLRHSLQQTKEAAANAAGLELLLVDDDPMMIARLSKQLKAAGYRVAVRSDGESALKYIIENQPPILITDWRMQPMDGIALTLALRTTDFGRKVYIIMLTSAESEDNLVAAFDAGIDDFLIKPVSSRVLFSRLRAGQRIVELQQEVEKERREVQRYTSELLAANHRLEMMAHTDMLTDLPNRRYALSRLAQEFETGLRFNRPLSVLMLDLDFFKSINDTLGHDAGDQVLVHVAKLTKQSLRAGDIACRLGGEEFIVIACNTDRATALLLAERIRVAIEKNQPEGLKLRRPLTVSVGVAGSIGPKPGWKELMVQADQALYRIKQGGRNGVGI